MTPSCHSDNLCLNHRPKKGDVCDFGTTRTRRLGGEEEISHAHGFSHVNPITVYVKLLLRGYFHTVDMLTFINGLQPYKMNFKYTAFLHYKTMCIKDNPTPQHNPMQSVTTKLCAVPATGSEAKVIPKTWSSPNIWNSQPCSQYLPVFLWLTKSPTPGRKKMGAGTDCGSLRSSGYFVPDKGKASSQACLQVEPFLLTPSSWKKMAQTKFLPARLAG